GGVAGIGLASMGVRLLVTYTPTSVPRLDDAGFHPVVMLFALGLTLVTGLLFGLAPALRAAHGNLLPALREGGRTSFATAGRGPGRAALVVGEIALALILVVGAGLFVRSAWRLQEVPVGFDPRGVLSARVGLPAERYRDDEAVVDAFRRILEMVRITPGVRRAGASTGIPLVGGAPDAELKVEGKVFPGDTAPSPFIRLITEDYVEAVGMPLVAGRSLLAADMAAGAPAVVLINERLARMAWPGENPLGKRLSTWTKQDEPEWREVVGVLGDIRSAGPTTPLSPELFLPYTQPPGEAWPAFQRSMAVVARASGNPAALAAPLGRVVRSIDPSLPVYDVMTMEDALGTRYASARFNMWLLSLLAVTGLVLAAVGIYGVIAYIVTQRTPEIGLRLALGATPASVLLLVLQQGTRLALAGIGVGLVGALGATSLVAALLFEVQPTDPATYVAGATAMFLIALLACAVPAWRAVRVNPVQVIAKS
ncbi:MAG TPA: FtsX-like permease family protein, partial [Aeromicrobium sp.]|nr:FtsX-like permease family protein [Aeromicrobium sp.]